MRYPIFIKYKFLYYKVLSAHYAVWVQNTELVDRKWIEIIPNSGVVADALNHGEQITEEEFEKVYWEAAKEILKQEAIGTPDGLSLARSREERNLKSVGCA